jgi:hypothetical protein
MSSNRYPGNCLVCDKHVKAGEGDFQKFTTLNTNQRKAYSQPYPIWLVRCHGCKGKGNNKQ